MTLGKIKTTYTCVEQHIPNLHDGSFVVFGTIPHGYLVTFFSSRTNLYIYIYTNTQSTHFRKVIWEGKRHTAPQISFESTPNVSPIIESTTFSHIWSRMLRSPRNTATHLPPPALVGYHITHTSRWASTHTLTRSLSFYTFAYVFPHGFNSSFK